MAVIYSYPEISLANIKQDDRFVISQMNEATNPTKSISIGTLASYVATKITPSASVTGTGLTDYILKWVDGPNGVAGDSNLIDDTTRIVCNQDFQLKPDGAGASTGSKSLIFSGIDNTGADISSGKIFTTDSAINPSGQDLQIQNADDNGNLQTNMFIDAFGFVGLGTASPLANLDVAQDLIVGTNVTFSGYGSGTKTGTATYNLAVDANGLVIETPSVSGIPWPYQYNVASGQMLQGENPATTQVGVTMFGVGAGANLGPTSGSASGDSGNTAFGYNALNLENNEVQCTAIGYKALGNQNVSAMFGVPSNTAVGYEAGMECTLSLADTFVGAEIKSVNPGQSTNNVGVGRSCLKNLTAGFANVALGAYALEGLISANQNIAIGWKANDGATTGNNNIVIGDQAEPSSLTVSNEITLGNSNHTTVVLPGGLINAVDDTAAAAAGVPINGLYRNVNAIQIRLV